MKAVILAAGEGTRMRPLTEDTPKPLLPVAGKPVLQYIIDDIDDYVDEIIVVACYMREKVEDYFSGTPVKVVEQEEPLGTADAALSAQKHIQGKTLVINGDDIYRVPAGKIESHDSGIVVDRVNNPENYGVIQAEDGRVTGIEEKPENPDSDLVNTGFYVVQEDFFSLLEEVEESERGEYEITDAIEKYLEEREMAVIQAEEWLPCSYPWQLVEANERLLEDTERRIEGNVADSVEIEGKVVVEESAEVKAHTVIEGPAIVKAGADIGPQAYIRPGTVVHENVKVGRTEVKNSVLRENTSAPHFSYIGDSYLDKNVNMGAGSKTANKRNDGEDILVEVKGKLLDSGRQKLGSFIGSSAKIGVNCSINPGIKIGSEAITDSNEKISRNLPSKSTLVDGELD